MIAFVANHAYCAPQKNFIGKVVGKKDVIGAYVFDSKFPISVAAVIIYFKGKTLTKEQWISRKTELIPFTFAGQETNLALLVDKEWFEDIKKMWPVMKSRIYEILEDPPYGFVFDSIIFTGHAIGGAYATLAAELWEIDMQTSSLARAYSYVSSRLVTFGAPRVGNQNFARLVNKHYLTNDRVTYKNDHVPHFPAKKLNGSKRVMEHSETEIWIKPLKYDCNCHHQGNDGMYWNSREEYFKCYGLNVAFESKNMLLPYNGTDILFPPDIVKSRENLACNAGQKFHNVPNGFVHQGPYFGIMMGNCNGFGDFGLVGISY
ncbi:hypothetical protein G9A89_020250 [Geosiphon pyriformis]|nr:hypothetical protein G9A89_020250 [Geosiphon pyriformis]